MQREKIIIRTSIIGILANVFLAAFKAIIGFLSNSIAVTLDAVNNLSDALSSVITIVGTKLAGKQPDKKHPFGYGRIEYLSAIIIAVIVLYAGITSLTESVKKIITPETPDYTPVALIIIGVAVAVKVVLGLFVSRTGKKVNSDSLAASGKDALLDSVISASTLVAAFVYLLWGVSLEAWLGAVISLVIIKSGIEMLRDSISSILGERADRELAVAVKKTVLGFPEVSGVYDLVLHDYGPDRFIGSLHIELPETYSLHQLDLLERRITEAVAEAHGVLLTGISVYAANTPDGEAAAVHSDIRKLVMRHEHVMQMHGFALNQEDKQIHFDIVIDFEEKDRGALYNVILAEVQQRYPDYRLVTALDIDTSE